MFKDKDKKKNKTEKTGTIRTLMYPLEKRLLLDASTLEATVNAIPNGVLNLDAQDLDGDGDFTDQPTTGTTIQTWHDKYGGTFNDAEEGTASRRAEYDENAFGTGIGGLTFDGDDTYTVDPENTINTSGPFPEKSFAVVFRTGTDTTGFQMIYEQGGSIRGFQVSIDDGNIYAAGYNDTGTEWGSDRFKIMNLGAVQANTTYRVIMVFDSTVGDGFIKANVNGGDFVQLNEVGAQANHSGNVGIGAEQGGTVRPSTLALTNASDANFFTGSIGQIMSWNTALDDDQIRAVDSYLVERWTNSPAIQFNTGDTVLEGGTALIDSTELYTVDRDTPPSGLTYQITGLLNGQVQLSGVDVGLGGTFTQADIDNNLITFVHDDSDTITANFEYRVTDGGTQDTDKFVIDVTPIDDAGSDPPAININTTQSVVQSGSVNITNTELQVVDTDTTPGSLNFTVTSTLNGSVFNTNLGTTVTAFTQDDIDNGFIRFDQDGTVNGFAGFDFDVSDGTTTISGTKNIGVTFPDTGANDPPVITVNTGDTINTAGSTQILNTNLVTSDPDNDITQIVYTITSVTNGTVFNGGTALTVGQTFTQADINFGSISFTHDGSLTSTASIGFDVSDGTTTVTGNTYDFGVVVNNPPVLGANPGPVSIFENASNGDSVFTANATDPESNNITYTIESGNALGIFQINPINGLVTILDNTNLDFEGTNTFNLVVRATDDGPGTPFDEYTVTVNVQNVNENPEGTDNTVTASEDVAYNFSAADFGFTDPLDSTSPSTLQSVVITTLPANGILELSGVAVTAGQEITLASIPNLTFTAAANDSGVGYTNFTFQVRDNGGTANGGIDLDTTPNTMTIDVDPVNDAPDGADITVTTLENTTYTFNVLDFTAGFTDANDTPSDLPFSVIITTLPTNGVLELSGVAVTAGQEIPAINVPNLTFTPALNASGIGYDSLTYQIRDDGGTANGGIDLDPTPNTVTFDVTPINSEPTGLDNTITTDEDTNYTFSAADFGFSDASDTPANNFQSVFITTLPANGTLELSGVAVTAGQEIVFADIPNLEFVPAANANGASYDSFTFQVRDDGGTANGGIDTDQTANTMTIDVNSVNDEPDGLDNTLTTDEDISLIFSAADFGFSDVNDGPDNLLSVIITTLPTNGALELSGVAVTAGQEIVLADIPNLAFVPAANASGAGYDSFTFQVRDDGGTANGGQDTDQTANTITIDVNSVNDAPDGLDNTLTVAENGTFTFSAGDFGFSDVNDGPDNLQSVFITTLPADGTIELSGVAVTAGQEILLADIPNLTFEPDAGDSGVGYASFTFQVRDDGGTANGGIDTDPVANTITFDVTPINDAPDGTDNTVTTDEDTDYTFSAADFGFTDALDTPANNFLSVIITTLPANGTLNLSGVGVTAGQEIVFADIPNLTFTPVANQNGAAYDSFTFQVRDDGGTANGGVDIDPVANTMTIDVTSINDAPDGLDNTITINEDTNYTFGAGDFGFTDVNDAPNNLLSVFITTIPTNGTLELSGVAVTAGQEILLADIPNLVFTPAPDASGVAYDSFTFQVRDDGGTPNGGQDTDQTANTITFDVDPINDAPVLTNNTLPTQTVDFSTFTIEPVINQDGDGGTPTVATVLDSGRTLKIEGNSWKAINLPLNITPTTVIEFEYFSTSEGELQGIGVDTDLNFGGVESTFQLFGTDSLGVFNATYNDYALSDGWKSYSIPIGTFDTGSFNYIYFISDDDGAAASNSYFRDVKIYDSATPDVDEGGTYTITTANITTTDPDDAPADITYTIDTPPVNGQVELSTNPGVAIGSFTQDDLDNSRVQYVHDGTDTLSDSFDFTVADGGEDGALPTSSTFHIVVNPVDEIPVLATNNGITLAEGATQAITTADLETTDTDSDPEYIIYTIQTGPLNGQVELTTNPGVAVTSFTQDDIDNGLVQYVHDDSETTIGDFTFEVTDNTTPLGTATFSISVTPVNDNAPVFTAFGPFDINELAADNDAVGTVTTTDADLPADTITYSITGGTGLGLFDIDLNTGDITVDGNGNFDFETTTSYTIDVEASDGTNTTTQTVTVNITNVNEAPEGGDVTLTTDEDTALSFTAGDFGFTDPSDTTAPNTLQSVVITTLPADGILELSGVAVTAGQDIALADIPNLTFTPAANENGLGYTSFTFQVRDDGGTADGGIDLDQTPNTVTIDVTPLNDAPDGTDTLVSTTENVAYTFAAGDFGFTDVNDTPANALGSVIITTLPVDGVLELSGVAVTAGQEILLADIPNLTFTPALNENGAAYADFTFQARDDGGTPNGGVDLDPTPNTMTIDVIGTNSAPDGMDTTLGTLENTTYTFSDADFGFSDTGDIPPDNFANVIITTLPADGILELSGVAVTAGQVIAFSDIPNLTFTPDINENGLAYTSFTFQVQDDGGTAFGGIDTDQTPNTITFDVTSINNEPLGADNTLTTLEDTPLAFTILDFGFSDPADTPANNLLSVIITTLPANGILELSGVAVTAGQEILAADIPNLTFTPAANENGLTYTDFTFQVRDDGGTIGPGIDTDQSPNTMTIDVTSVNDVPDGTDTTVTTLEDTPYTFSDADFGFTDAADTPANLLQSVIITTLPVNGVLELSGVAVTAGQEILASDIPNLVFTPVANENGAAYADFTFQVRDDGGTADGGIDLDPVANTITIDVTSVNDAPDSLDNTVTTLEDTAFNFSAGDFSLTDVNDTPANTLSSVLITTLPLSGTLELSGVAVTAGQVIALADIANLAYVPAANNNGLAAADFTFQVVDDGGTTDGGIDTDQTPNIMTIDITSVNDAPDGTDATLSVLENATYTFGAGDFGFTDPDELVANNLQSVIITTIPADGVLELSGVAVTAGQEILLADIPNLTFSPAFNENGIGYTSFTFQVRDDGGTADGGIDLDPVANTITFDVDPVNSEPDGTDNIVTTLEDTPYTFSDTDFGFTDLGDAPLSNNLQSVIITTLPVNGILELSGVAVTAGDEILVADIPNLVFTPVANENGVGYADFTFQVRDDGGTANGGIDLDAVPNTITIDVTSVNDEPDGADITLTTLEDTPLTFDPANFGFSDVNDAPDNFNSVFITTLPASGILELSGVAVTAGDEILVADIPNLTYTPPANANGAALDTFTFQVRDDGGTLDGGIDTDQTANTVTIDVTSVNDEPDGTDNTVTTLEDTPLTFAAADFGFTDVNDAPDNFQSVIITTLPVNGILELSGVAVTAGDEILATDIPNLVFTPVANENGAGYADFTFQVRDDGGTTDGGIDLDAVPNTMTIDVTSVNDAPEGADNTLATFEDTPYTFGAADFGFTDPTDLVPNNFQSVVITTLPANGILELSGVAVTAGQDIALADIPNLTFTPGLNDFGLAYTTFTFQVRDDGGTADGGIDLDPTPNTITFDVVEVDDPPLGADNTLTTLEDTPLTFAAADFGFSDPDDTPADNFVSVVITTLPANGILELSGVAVTAGQDITVADIPNLTFTPGLNDNGLAYTDFTFQVRDDGVNNLDPTPNTMTIDVTPVDDPPVIDTNVGMNTFEGFTETLTNAMLSSSDVDTPTTAITYNITTPPVNGQIELTSGPGVAVTSFTQDDIDNNRVVYVHNSSETITDSFDFEITDGNTVVASGVPFNINITPVNDEPIGTDNTLTTLEDTPLAFTAGDFGFTDPNDTPANNLQSVIITTLPVNGTLELSGVAVTAGDEILLADIPNLSFIPAPNANGLAYDSFTFQVRDDGGTANTGVDTDQSPNTMTIDVTSINDAPDGTDNTITMLENQVYTFADSDFGFTDPNDIPANNLESVVITTIPVTGVLELSGVAVTAGDEILLADIPNLTFTPLPNGNGNAYDSFTFQVRDNGGTADGGINLDPVENTITFDVLPVNSEPFGADATLNTLEDTPYTFSDADFGFTDPNDVPPETLLSVIVTTLPANGILELSGVAVTAGDEILLADIPNLTFTPSANENGVGYTDFTFQVRDTGGTANGGIDTDTTPNTITFDVTPVNDAPEGTDNTVTILEDTNYTFSAADFGFTDPNDPLAPNALQSVVITTLPVNGTLELSGVAVTAGQELLLADIPNLTFSPITNENGAAYDTFTFQVRDDGGTADGGIDLDPTPNTMTIDVTSVNDEPDGTDNTVTTLEDTAFTFSAGDFGLTDVSDMPANDLASVIITTLPVDGILELSGVAVTAGDEILLADIPNLTFTPAANENGASYADFTFQVRDDGGTTDGGIDLDSTPNTMTIDVTPVNDEPSGIDVTLGTAEDTPFTLNAADFGFSDVIDTPSDNFLSVIITTLPAVGTLELSGVAVTAGQEVALADIPNLEYTPPLNLTGLAADTFTFQVRDDGGTADGGIDTDQSPNTVTIDIFEVNDAPEGADNTLITLEDTPLTFAAADFGFSDPSDTPSNNFQNLIITTLPVNGILELSGVAVTAGQSIAVGDIPNLTFTPAANENGAGYADFTFQVQDDGGTAGGGVDTDQTPNTMTIDVTSVNDEPDGADITLTTLEDTPYTFGAGDFGFSDVNDTPANNLQSVVITTLPVNGVLELSGVAVTAGQDIALADIPNLTFTPALNEFGAAYTDFTFQVRDDGGTTDGGVDLDSIPNTITFDVTEVNDEPIGTDNTVTTLEDTDYTFSAGDFGFSDPSDTPADNFQNVIITTLPLNGTLNLSGVPVTAGQSIAVSDIPNLVFSPAANENGAGYADFTFQVQDDGGTADGGIDTDQSPNTMTIDVTSVNDAPDGADATLTTLEDVPYTFAASDFGLTDVNDVPANNLQSVIINTLPADGLLELSGVAVTAGQEILASDLANLTFTPATNEFGANYANFDFQVRDDGGTSDGGIDLDPTPNTITFDVTPVNDAPFGTDNTLTTLEDTPLGFTAADFGFSDPDDVPSNNFQSIIIDTIPISGTFELSGVAVTAGQTILVSDLPNLVYTPALNGAGTGFDNFTFRVVDDGGTSDGGQDTDQIANIITIDVTEVNDAPEGTDNTVTTNEDIDYVFAGSDFGFTDPNDTPNDNFQSVIINTLPLDGDLLLSGVAVTAGQEILSSDIPNLVFRPAANEFGVGYASFDFQVRDDGGTANGGVDLDPTQNTMTINVNSVNDEPSGTDITLTTLEDTPLGFTATDFGFSDVNDAPNNFNSIFISSLPINGVLELSGIAVTAGQEILVSDLPNLFFTPALNDNGAGYDNFTFQVRDDGGTPNGGQDTDQTPNTVTIDVTPVNDEPQGADNTVTTLEDTTYTFAASDFGFTDISDVPADDFASVIINTLPINGVLELSGVAVIAGDEITVSDIPNLTFTPITNENGLNYANFDFQVRDDGGTANGGVDLDSTSNTMTIDVTSVNDEPAGADNTITILEDTPYSFAVTDFGLTDINDTPANNLQTIRIVSLPTNGVLGLAPGASTPGLVSAGQVISAADIPFLVFSPDLNDNGVGYASFDFQVQDDGGTANGGVDTDQTPNTITFDVTPVNDAPEDITLSSLTFPEGISSWNIGSLGAFDVDSSVFTYSIVSADPIFTITGGNILSTTGPKFFGVDPSTYDVTLRVSDGFLTFDETFTIQLLPEPVTPIVSDPASNFGKDAPQSTNGLSEPGLQFYILNFLNDLRSGELFRYGMDGIIDSSLAPTDTPLKDAYYSDAQIDEIIKRNVVIQLQELAQNIENVTGTELTVEQLADIFGLDVLLFDMEDAGDLGDTDNKSIDESFIYETNDIYKALVALNNEATEEDETIADKTKQNNTKYLHAQLDEAALYYSSKQSKLIEALSKRE
ncbi:MAG: cadherin-like domain-containing protein [Pseudomonadota bacterium]